MTLVAEGRMKDFDDGDVNDRRRLAFTPDELEGDDRISWFWVVFGPPINPRAYVAPNLFDAIRLLLTLLGAVVGAVALWRFGIGWSVLGAIVGAWAWKPLLIGPLLLVVWVLSIINRLIG